ncbi:MAG: hypothetical protein NTY45_10105 [Elusimicrobia bacterium]|nr:hypothetical protein [Elusimicrobiota bacterium]
MKNIVAIVALMLAGNSLWAQPSEDLKPLELNTVSLQAVKAVALPEVKLSPVPVGSVTRTGIWKHIDLYAADGTVITVDYAVQIGGLSIADPVWINITNPAFGRSNEVRVTLTNYQDRGVSPGLVQATQKIKLTYAGGTRYTGQAKKVLLFTANASGGGNYIEDYRQGIEVTVDGKKLTTTQGDSSTFGFKMDRNY